jgi:hypothetical protein
MKAFLLPVLAAVVSATAAMTPVRAGDIQGDAYECNDLWVMRNQIYKDNGFCFTSSKAITYFGNGGCSYHSTGTLPLSHQDHLVLHDIKKSEARQGC